MPQYMLLYQSDAQAQELMASATPEEMQASMKDWISWRDSHGGDDKIHFGLPLQPRCHIDPDKSEPSTLRVGGYATVNAESLEEVCDLIKDHPHLKRPGSSIDVLEMLKMPGM